MSPADERSPLVEQVLAGSRPELETLAAEGLLPLPLDELIELQVALAASKDERISKLATTSLTELEPRAAAAVLGEGTKPQVLAYLAFHLPHPTVLETILRLRATPHALLEELAPRLGAEMQEILLLRQDAIVERASILEALEVNPELSAYSRRRIREYREHLLPTRKPPTEVAAEIEEKADRLSEEEVQEAIETAAQVTGTGQLDEQTGLLESQIRSLPTPVRLRLSRGCPRSLRLILIRDANPQVATSVIKNNPLSEGEVEEIAANRSVRSEVLQAISNNRSWMRRYPIVLALVRNPRSPAAMAIRLVSRLALRDMQSVSRDHNVPHAVRLMAGRLYRMKRK